MPSVSRTALHELRMRLSSPALDQGHLFAGWPDDEAAYTPSQLQLLTELATLSYQGGIDAYVRRGRELLAADQAGGGAGQGEGISALERPTHLYAAPDLFTRSPELDAMEATGAELAQRTVYVLVAGGLGERLGYSDVKVGLPVETSTMRSYLEHYLSWARAAAGAEVPFVIMTSADTHARTVALMDELQIGMPNLRLLRQETVPCFEDAAAHLAVDPADGSRLLRKPHGHGDVHALLCAARASAEGEGGGSLLDSWLARGYEYVVFFQDTNATAVLTIPVSLAVSAREGLDMNFTCIPRVPGEAIGLLCRTRRRERDAAGQTVDRWRTAVVEYNVFAGLAQSLSTASSSHVAGDVAAAGSAFSPFPGSINTLVLRLAPYRELLTASGGAVPEFINPKYTDARRMNFQKPARIESLMQDVALLFSEEHHRVGGTTFSRFSYQPVKNALAAAGAMAAAGATAFCAATAEEGWYALARRRLRGVGVRVEGGGAPGEFSDGEAVPSASVECRAPDVTVAGTIPVRLLPVVCLDATAGMGCAGRAIGGLADLARVFPHPERVHISARSVLLIEGRVIVESLRLDGVLRIEGPPHGSGDVPLTVRELSIETTPWTVRPVTDADTAEVDRMRGYVMEKTPPRLISRRSQL